MDLSPALLPRRPMRPRQLRPALRLRSDGLAVALAVGDSYEKDVAPAPARGWRAVLVGESVLTGGAEPGADTRSERLGSSHPCGQLVGQRGADRGAGGCRRAGWAAEDAV